MLHKCKGVVTVLSLLALIGPTMTNQQDVKASTGYRRTKTTAVSHKDYYSMNTKAATYSANGSTTHFKFKLNHYLKNYKNTTWTRTSKTYITKHGKRYLYYYVHNAKSGVAGWVWHGYLKAGKNYQLTSIKNVSGTYVKNRSGKIYPFQSGYNPISFSGGRFLSSTASYKKSKQAYIYKKGIKYLYYYVTGSNGTKGWIWHSYLKTAPVGTTHAAGTNSYGPVYATTGDVLDNYKTANFSLVTPKPGYTTAIAHGSYQKVPAYAANVFQTTADTLNADKHYGTENYNFKTAMFLPVTYNKSGDLGNPQSAAFNKDDTELYVAYNASGSEGSDSQQGYFVRYDWKKLMQQYNEPMSAIRHATWAHSNHSENATDQAVLRYIHVGTTTITGHIQGLALNPKTNELWYVDKTKAGAAEAQRLDPSSLKPNATVDFSLKSTVPMSSNLTFDNNGTAYMWTRTVNPWATAPKNSVKIYKGTLSTNRVHFSLVMQGLSTAPGIEPQGIAYNNGNGRLYFVSDESIASVPVKDLGKLKASEINEITFDGNREFEGLVFAHSTNQEYLLTNKGAEMMAAH